MWFTGQGVFGRGELTADAKRVASSTKWEVITYVEKRELTISKFRGGRGE